MDDSNLLQCPNCGNHNFLIKYEATYVYSYNIDSNAPGLKNTEEFLPFMYDKREQKDARQYMECKECLQQFPFYLSEWDNKIGAQELQRAVKNINNING